MYMNDAENSSWKVDCCTQTRFRYSDSTSYANHDYKTIFLCYIQIILNIMLNLGTVKQQAIFTLQWFQICYLF